MSGECVLVVDDEAAIRRLLRGALDMQTSSCEPRGCMRVISSMTYAEDDSIRADLLERRASTQRALCERLERAIAEGDLPADTDVNGLASYLGAILQGMSIQSRSGATKAQLVSLVETTLAMWPGK